MAETPQAVIPAFDRSVRIGGRAAGPTGDPGAVLLREIPEPGGIGPWMDDGPRMAGRMTGRMTGRLQDPRRQVAGAHDLAARVRTGVLLA